MGYIMFEELLIPKCRKIGITEQSDPSINYTWINKIKNTDCSLLITKNLTNKLIDEILKYKSKIILHYSITGYGGSLIEPNIYEYEKAFEQLKILIEKGFNKNQIVIRVDPIITMDGYFEKSLNVFERAINEKYSRLRFSFIDIYPHVKQRFIEKHIILNESKDYTKYINKIRNYKNHIKLESCCENEYKQGCISEYDIELLGFKNTISESKNKQRSSCLCLPKKELITVERKQRCPYECLYCYWKD